MPSHQSLFDTSQRLPGAIVIVLWRDGHRRDGQLENRGTIIGTWMGTPPATHGDHTGQDHAQQANDRKGALIGAAHECGGTLWRWTRLHAAAALRGSYNRNVFIILSPALVLYW